jgi:hypothetical protein
MAVKKKSLVVAKSKTPAKIKKAVTEAISTEVIVSSVEDKAKGHFSKLKKLSKITSKEDMEIAGQQVKALKEIAKEAKKQKEGITNPIYEAIAKIEELFKPFENKVKNADTETKLLIQEFLDDSEKKLKQVEHDFKTNKIKKVSTFTEKTNELQVGSTGATKVRKVTKMFITDAKKIPDKFYVIDEGAVEAALKNGEKVPGAELKKVNSVAI